MHLMSEYNRDFFLQLMCDKLNGCVDQFMASNWTMLSFNF